MSVLCISLPHLLFYFVLSREARGSRQKGLPAKSPRKPADRLLSPEIFQWMQRLDALSRKDSTHFPTVLRGLDHSLNTSVHHALQKPNENRSSLIFKCLHATLCSGVKQLPLHAITLIASSTLPVTGIVQKKTTVTFKIKRLA